MPTTMISNNDTYLAIQIIYNGESKQIIMNVDNSGRSTVFECSKIKHEIYNTHYIIQAH